MSQKLSSKNQRAKGYHQFCQQVYDIVRTIPEGRVMTYGGIAALIPCPPSYDPLAYARIRARWVGYALKVCPEDVPWWRVVNTEGAVSLRMGHGPHIQPLLLEKEGLCLQDRKIAHLTQHLWDPKRDGTKTSGFHSSFSR